MRKSYLLPMLVCLAVGACEDSCEPTVVDTEAFIVFGTVRLNGAPAPGLQVSLVDGSSILESVLTDAQGGYQINYQYPSEMPLVTPEVRVSPPSGMGFVDNPRSGLQSHDRADFVGYALADISGTATWNGVGIEGVSVVALGGSGINLSFDEAVTDASGAYSISSLAPGRYGLLASTSSGAGGVVSPASTSVELLGQDIAVDFTVEFGAGPLEGRVSAAGSGLQGVIVTATGLRPATTQTDAAGDYSFPSVPIGTHTVSISGYDASVYAFPITTQPVTLARGETGRADFDATIIVQNAPPVATITSPADGSLIATGTMIQLAGSGSDTEDGALTGAMLVWSSSLDGPLGTGAGPTAVLSEGAHAITLTATDSEGATGTATANVEVIVNQPPVVTIESPTPDQILTQGQAITFVGSGSDPEDGTLTGQSLVWSSDVEGQFGTGESLSHAFNTTGFHYITLTGTDSLGATASATVRVYVQPN